MAALPTALAAAGGWEDAKARRCRITESAQLLSRPEWWSGFGGEVLAGGAGLLPTPTATLRYATLRYATLRPCPEICYGTVL